MAPNRWRGSCWTHLIGSAALPRTKPFSGSKCRKYVPSAARSFIWSPAEMGLSTMVVPAIARSSRNTFHTPSAGKLKRPRGSSLKAAGPETKPAASITQPGEIDPIFSSLFPSEPTEAKGPVLDAAGKPEEPAEPEILNSDIFNIDPLLKLPDDFKEPLMPDMPADPAVPDEPPTFPGSAPTAEEKSNTAAAAESSDGAATDAKASGETATDSGGGNYKYAHIPRFVRDMLELPKDTLTAMAPKIAPENRAPAQKGPAGPKGDEVVLPPHPELPLADLAHSSSASQAPAGTSPSTGISLS